MTPGGLLHVGVQSFVIHVKVHDPGLKQGRVISDKWNMEQTALLEGS